MQIKLFHPNHTKQWLGCFCKAKKPLSSVGLLHIKTAVFFTAVKLFSNYSNPTLFGFNFMPGPIVVATTQDLMYCPLLAAGFAFTIALSNVSKF